MLMSHDATRCAPMIRKWKLACALLAASGLAAALGTGCESQRAVQQVEVPVSEPLVVVAEKPAEPVKPATANVTRVTFAEEGSDFDPAVSRDGEKLVFASTQHRSTSDIYVKRTNARVLTQLTNDAADDAMPSISPDGQRIAFASNRAGNWDIYVMPISGGKAVQVTSDAADELHPSWSPDGTELVFSRLGEASGRWEMWVTDTTGGGTTNFIGYGMFPQWCPVAGTGSGGGDRILFQLGRERGRRTFGVWTLDYRNGTAGNQTEIAASAESALINPTWSLDGRWIAYAEVPGADADGPGAPGAGAATSAVVHATTERGLAERDADGWTLPPNASLWMIGIDGTGRVNLASGGGSTLMPTWAPGNRLYFVSNREGNENIWSLDLGPALLAATGQPPAAGHPVANAPEEAPAGDGR